MVATDPNLYADSGASTHVISNTGTLFCVKPYIGIEKLYIGDGKGLNISHTVKHVIKSGSNNLSLNNVLVVPEIRKKSAFN